MKDISAEARIFVHTGSMGRNDRKKKRVCPESVLKIWGGLPDGRLGSVCGESGRFCSAGPSCAVPFGRLPAPSGVMM